MSEVKHYRLDVYESNKSGEFETYVDMKESEPSRFTYVKSSDYDSLKDKLEKAEKVIASINLDFKTYGLFHYDDCASVYDEDEKCSCGAFSAEKRINKAIREYLKGEG